MERRKELRMEHKRYWKPHGDFKTRGQKGKESGLYPRGRTRREGILRNSKGGLNLKRRLSLDRNATEKEREKRRTADDKCFLLKWKRKRNSKKVADRGG